jgi:glutathione S-transferase
MSDLIFYTNPQSRGRIVRWMLEEVGAPYETRVIDYATMKGPDYLAVNPMGKVPAITHGDTVVTECAAICAYLADAFPEAGLAPPHGHRKRGDLLSLALLRGRASRGGGDQQGAEGRCE